MSWLSWSPKSRERKLVVQDTKFKVGSYVLVKINCKVQCTYAIHDVWQNMFAGIEMGSGYGWGQILWYGLV